MPTLETINDERNFLAYRADREACRDAMRYGVLPNIANALAQYERFEQALAGGQTDPETGAVLIPDYSEWSDFHAGVVAFVDPYILQMRQMMAGIMQIATAIDTAAIAGGQGSIFGTAQPESQEEQSNE